MSDLFIDKNIKPMLIGIDTEPFDSHDYIFELKFDGIRCIAYLDKTTCDLRNKRNVKMLSKVPELSNLHLQVKKRCILDGELTVIKDGLPDFFKIQKRVLMSKPIKIELESKNNPACFTAFDILYYDDHTVTDLSLEKRKKLLNSVVKNESNSFSISREVEYNGIAFYELAKKQNLEGIVAKKKGSKYYFDKRTTDWQKIKFMQDEEFIICGYINKENNIKSLILGQFSNGSIIDKGHVTLGINTEDFKIISKQTKASTPSLEISNKNKNAIWIKPTLVCTVKYMTKTTSGGLRQPVFKGLRADKTSTECIETPI